MSQPASPRCRHPPWAPSSACRFYNPDAVLIGLRVGGVMQSPGVRAAQVAEMDVASFIAHLGRMGTLLLL
jgi:hypothetical protein